MGKRSYNLDADTETLEDSSVTDGNADTDADEDSMSAPDSATAGPAESAPEPAGDLPHRIRHDSPKDERKQVTFYLAESDFERLHHFESLANREFDESVHKLDVYVAAFRANGTDGSFLAEMRTLGYGYFD